MDLPQEYRNKLIFQFQVIGKHLRESCKLCNGEGSIQGTGFGMASRCPACMVKFDEMKKYINSGISPEFLNVGIEKAEYTKETKTKLEQVINGYPHYFGRFNFIFHKLKNTSSAFTLAGILLLKKYIEANYQSFYIDFSQLFDFFINFKSEDSEFKTQMVNYCTKVPVLMIDNFCNNYFKSETKEGFLFQNLEKLLRMRLNTGLTILATNLEINDLHNQFKLLSPLLKASYQPMELYCKVDKHKQTTALDKTDIPANIKGIFKQELQKLTPTDETDIIVKQETEPTKRKKSINIDDINHRG